jgi:hypothetical protein
MELVYLINEVLVPIQPENFFYAPILKLAAFFNISIFAQKVR